MPQSNQTRALQRLNAHSGVRKPQLPEPFCPRACALQQEKSPQQAGAQHLEGSLHSRPLGKAHVPQRTPSTAKKTEEVSLNPEVWGSHQDITSRTEVQLPSHHNTISGVPSAFHCWHQEA